MNDLNYSIPKVNPAAAIKATSKEVVEMKSEDKQKTKVKIYDDGFKIPLGTQHHLRKKLESAECVMIIKRILDRDLDPSGVLIDVVKVRHKLTPYGFCDREWRCYFLYLMHRGQIYTTLAQVARKLVMGLEPKITEVELIRDCVKNPLEPTAMKEAKLYLYHIKTDRYRIKYLVDCFPSNTGKRQHDKSESSDSALMLNVRTKGLLAPPHWREKARWIRNVHHQTEREKVKGHTWG